MSGGLKPCPLSDSRVMPEPMSGCWIWIGARQSRGYGHLAVHGSAKLAHRWSYELQVGLIPEGLVLDHKCRNRACVNPKHLRPVTQKQNNAASDSVTSQNARKTHCSQGHELTAENIKVVVRKDGTRRKCRTCDIMQKRNSRRSHDH